MTAGVVVMNASAVALAADSTVTIPHRDGAKHYRGANKIVSFHSKAPVAVFWYGSPEYLGVPWEVVFKDFRSSDDKLRPTVGGYVTALFDYVDQEVVGWAPSSTDGDPAAAVLVRPVLDRVTKALRIGVADPVATTESEIARWAESLRPRKRVLDDTVVDGYAPLWTWLDDELDALAGDLGALPDDVYRALREAARSAWTHLSPHEPLHTGIVVAGFGENQRVPAMCPYLVGVPVGPNPRRAAGDPVVVTADQPAIIVPFALNEDVRLFMEGISPDLRRWLAGALGELNEMYGLDDAAVDRLTRLFEDRIYAYGRPIVDAVRFLPKADLAEFARQMVAFTAFRLRMSMAVESVGEPIDVAVVSRAEGVVWVRRTHYFPPELNPQFLTRYR